MANPSLDNSLDGNHNLLPHMSPRPTTAPRGDESPRPILRFLLAIIIIILAILLT